MSRRDVIVVRGTDRDVPLNDLDGWTLPDLIGTDDVRLFGRNGHEVEPWNPWGPFGHQNADGPASPLDTVPVHAVDRAGS